MAYTKYIKAETYTIKAADIPNVNLNNIKMKSKDKKVIAYFMDEPIELREDLAHYIENINKEIKRLTKERNDLKIKIWKLENRLRLGWIHLLFNPYK